MDTMPGCRQDFTLTVVQPQTKKVGMLARWLIVYNDYSGALASFSNTMDFSVVIKTRKLLQEDRSLGPREPLRIFDVYHDKEVTE